MRVACVLRSGKEYGAQDVQWLWNAVRGNYPHARFICLSDVPVPCERVSLQHNWPGWWSKMELFRPDIPDDLLYIDLDTVVTGDLRQIANARRLTMLGDFYHLDRLASGVLFLPFAERAAIWKRWIADPAGIIAACERFDANGVRGDGKFLGELLAGRAQSWQSILPGQIVSYKVHVRKKQHPRESGDGTVPLDARLVCFHGQPRPSALKDAWIKEARRDWSGETVFLIGGGPSAGQLDLERLRGKGRVIAINDSARPLPWADAVFTIDDSWVSMRSALLREFKGQKIFALQPKYQLPAALEKCELLDRIDDTGLSRDPMRVFMGFNSGYGAINLAVARGAKRIVLIGFDMTTAGHWHGGYEWRCRFGVAEYPDWARSIEALAPQIAQLGIDVVNLNPNSAIRCFRFSTMNDLLGVAAA